MTGPSGHPRRSGPERPWAPAAPGTVEAWAIELVTTTNLEHKTRPPQAPLEWEAQPPARMLALPGRPPELRAVPRGLRLAKQLGPQRARAKLIHTLLHHELQAAELMAWALLRFVDTPPAFRKGLLAICLDEVRHLNLYRQLLERDGLSVGSFPVRDWFWQRVPTCQSPRAFVALMGMGLEAANLEHAPRFGQRLEAAGDPAAAAVQRQVARDEEGHVRFAVHWWQKWAPKPTFEQWCADLPEPLTPLLMRGSPLARQARLRAGMSPEFLEQLDLWQTPQQLGPSR